MTIGIEKEVKFRLASWEEGERLLKDRGARLLEPRHFERNSLFDFPGGVLKERGEALRLRRAAGAAWLTLKKPLPGSGRLKESSEYETALEDPDALASILSGIGLEEQFRYEKYRAVYGIGELTACLDESPIGVYLELEGSPSAIETAAAGLSLSMDEAIVLTYPALYLRHRQHSPDSPRFMLFPAEKRPRPT
jgi:adenylate cyclase class 2